MIVFNNDVSAKPCLFIGTPKHENNEIRASYYWIDDFKLGEAAIKYLVSKGHKHIGIIGGNLADNDENMNELHQCANYRAEGALHLANAITQYMPCKCTMKDGYITTKIFLQKSKSITALFYTSDLLAAGGMRAIHEMNLICPDDISVLCVDETGLPQYISPQLTSFSFDISDAIHKGIDDLLLQASVDSRQPRTEYLLYSISESESVRTIK